MNRLREISVRIGLLSLLGAALSAGGCAKQPPISNTLSGLRLIVTMTYRGTINPNDYYYFVIGNFGDQDAEGPIPVLSPTLNGTYGNGFATGNGGTSGFTDFVVYNTAQPNGYALYHVPGITSSSTFTANTNASNFQYKGSPINYTYPDPTNPSTANQLQFEIDMSQLVYDANGQPLTSETETATTARAIRWLQVNMISTNLVPVDSNLEVDKQVDALGDSQTITGDTSFLILDLTQHRTFRNSDYVGQSIYEPSEPDVYGIGGTSNASIDLVDWSIQVEQQ